MLEKLVTESAALEKAMSGERLSYQDGMEIMQSDNIHMIGAVADAVRKNTVGDDVNFVSSYYLNYSNVCAASCQMCAFYRKGNEDDAYALSTEEIVARVDQAKNWGASEVHIVGGFHPKLSLDYYEDMIRAIKKSHPSMIVKAFTAAEVLFFARLTHNSVKEIISRLKDAGLDAMPGGGAELFHPDIRPKIARGKCSGQEWLDTIKQAHEQGITSNATMLFGHIEKPEHVVDHLIKIRDLQEKTGGFNTMIPLKFSLENTELEKDGLVTQESAAVYDLKVIALCRLLLTGALNNISVYWVALGKKLAQVALSYGGSDLVGTAFSEEIYKAAGKPTNGSLFELANMVKEIKRNPVERDTFFNEIRRF